MDDNRHTIKGQPHIELHAVGAVVNRVAQRGQRIFRSEGRGTSMTNYQRSLRLGIRQKNWAGRDLAAFTWASDKQRALV